MKNNLETLQQKLQYQFKNTKLLDTALTHRSFLNESPAQISNERLEYLGDAVLELAISDFLYHELSNEPEGVLTAARSAIVRTESLAKIATNLTLGEYLHMSHGEEKGGGRNNVSLLANTTEAVIGAIYLDGGYPPAQEFINNHIIPFAENISSKDLKDAKSLLQEKVQEKGYNAPVYETVSETGPDHAKIFTVKVSIDNNQTLALGSGKNKQSAQQQAAQKALKSIQTLAPRA